MNRPSFEDSVRAALASTAPGEVPAALEQHARSIPARRPVRWRWLRSSSMRAFAGLAVVLVAVVVSAAVLARPTTNGGRAEPNPISYSSPFGSLAASDFALVVGEHTFVVPGPRDSSSDIRLSYSGTAMFGSFEMHWIEHNAPMTLVAYVAADARTWWVSEIVASEGRSDGAGWLYFEGPFFERPRGSAFEGDAALRSSRSIDATPATLRFGHLRLTAFADGASARDPTKGTMPPPPPGGGTVDESLGPDFIAVAGPDGIAGYAPRALVNGGTSPVNGYVGQAPDVPVYADDLRTLVGYFIVGRGFVALADLGGSQPPTPEVATAPSSVPGSTPASVASLNPGEVLLPTSPPGSGSAGDTRLEGVLAGEVRDGHACFWIELPNVPSAKRLALIWPAGYHAYADPILSIHASDYRVIALVGTPVVLGGGGQPVGYVPTPDQDPCGLGQVFVVAGVVSVGSGPPPGSEPGPPSSRP